MTTSFPLLKQRSQFPALAREVGGRPAVFFDGPAGSQVPQRVLDAVTSYLTHTNANVGGEFATAIESDRTLQDARTAFADFLGAPSPDEIVFGANMTSLTFILSAALARTWRHGDEIVVTRLDHDANVTPWVEAARDAGARVRHVDIVREDCSIDIDDLERKLGERTRLVAVSAASNLVGTVQPVSRIAEIAHAAGALVFVDAVHWAPHRAIDVAAWGSDFVCCSAYKFFGPHVGVLWGRGALLRELPARKVRPASSGIPGRWLVGTQNHEGIAGAAAAVEYIADLGRAIAGRELERRAAITTAFSAIELYERSLAQQLLAGLAALQDVRVWGIADPDCASARTPTVGFTHPRCPPREIARGLAHAGIFVWPGNSYAVALTEALGIEPDGVVRIGLLHYNHAEEIERLLDALAACLR